MSRIAIGDKAAFTELYLRHRDRVFAFAYRMVGGRAIAEDVTHEAFLVLIEHPERYNAQRGTLLTFLCAIVRYNLISYFRRQGKQVEDEFCNVTRVEKGTDSEFNPLS